MAAGTPTIVSTAAQTIRPNDRLRVDVSSYTGAGSLTHGAIYIYSDAGCTVLVGSRGPELLGKRFGKTYFDGWVSDFPIVAGSIYIKYAVRNSLDEDSALSSAVEFIVASEELNMTRFWDSQ